MVNVLTRILSDICGHDFVHEKLIYILQDLDTTTYGGNEKFVDIRHNNLTQGTTSLFGTMTKLLLISGSGGNPTPPLNKLRLLRLHFNAALSRSAMR